jgi:hypothetical protein
MLLRDEEVTEARRPRAGRGLGRRDHESGNLAVAERKGHRAGPVEAPTADRERGDHLFGVVGRFDSDEVELGVFAVCRCGATMRRRRPWNTRPQSSSIASSVNTAANAAESPRLVVSMNAHSGAGMEVVTSSPRVRVTRP